MPAERERGQTSRERRAGNRIRRDSGTKNERRSAARPNSSKPQPPHAVPRCQLAHQPTGKLCRQTSEPINPPSCSTHRPPARHQRAGRAGRLSGRHSTRPAVRHIPLLQLHRQATAQQPPRTASDTAQKRQQNKPSSPTASEDGNHNPARHPMRRHSDRTASALRPHCLKEKKRK